MFTLQWAQIENALRQGGELGDSAITALSQLGNCIAPLQHRGPVELVSSYPNAAPFPLGFDSIEGAIAPLIVDNPFSYRDGNNHIHNGFAAFFRGVVTIDGDLVIRNMFNNPANPGGQPGGGTGGGVVPPYGPGGSSAPPTGGITIINSTGQSFALTALYPAIATSTITARSTTTYGTGPVNRHVMAGGALTGFVEGVTALNPFDFSITSGTYLVLGKMSNGFGNPDAYVIVAVDGTFEPAYAVRNNGDVSGISSGTASTVQFSSTYDIHKYPNDTTVFELSSYELTIKKSGLYSFSYIVPIRPVSASSEGQIWLEEGGTKIPGSAVPILTVLNSTEVSAAPSHTIDHVVDVSGGNKVYRVRAVMNDGYDVVGTDATYNGGYARLDVRRVRSL